MPHYQRLREVASQLSQQGYQCSFLFQRTGVGGLSVCGKPAFVADAYGMAVVSPAMRSDFLQWSSTVNFSVARQVEVIAYVTPATVTDVLPPAIVKAQAHALRRSRAMNDE